MESGESRSAGDKHQDLMKTILQRSLAGFDVPVLKVEQIRARMIRDAVQELASSASRRVRVQAALTILRETWGLYWRK